MHGSTVLLRVDGDPGALAGCAGATLRRAAGRDRAAASRITAWRDSARRRAIAFPRGRGRLRDLARSTASSVEYRNVVKRYPGQAEPAINDLSLTVPAGEICVLVGPSGCGKTTALRLVNRMIELTEGDILIDGHEHPHRVRPPSCGAASAT